MAFSTFAVPRAGSGYLLIVVTNRGGVLVAVYVF